MQTSRLLLARSIVAVTQRSCILTALPWPVVPGTRVDDVDRIQQQINCFVRHHSSSSTSGSTGEPTPENVAVTVVVYESPIANVVGKLRGVSLMTALIGAIGVPMLVAVKGSIPDVGILAVASTFVTGSLGSTAAIHYIFGPYVYRLERIPVRVCSSSPKPLSSSLPKEEETTKPNDAVGEEEEKQHHVTSASSQVADKEAIKQPEQATSSAPPPATTTTTTPSQQQCNNKPTLLKATIKSIFLRPKYVVFDPTTDVVPYQGLRPMCNLLAKGVPLYVHPEFVHDNALRKILKLDEMEAKLTATGPTKENPDDFL